MQRYFFQTMVLWCLLVLGGCANLSSDYDPPRITMDSLKVLPSEGAFPRFEIKVRVSNPNTRALDIAGVSYSLELLGKELFHGVTNEVPKIEAYSEEVITLEAGIQMFQVIRLLAKLGSAPNTSDALAYRFAAKVDFNGLTPTQRIEETGEISLDP